MAYYTVVYFGFIGAGRESRDYILSHFWGKNGGGTLLKVTWYILVGGAIAGVFQLAETAFVPVQSFILGATWPSIVGQLLSGRQAGPSEGELRKWGITPETPRLEEEKAQQAARGAREFLRELGLPSHEAPPAPGQEEDTER
ncbi:MAG: hypothetical protein HY532_01525 [Chloroflexi bacterium]|nr:hypothetical protein [Chloroflexota bacterium]